MISEFLRSTVVSDQRDVDGVDYSKARSEVLFYFPDHDWQQHFKEEKCYLVGDQKFTNGEDWHAPIDGLSYVVNSDNYHGTDFVHNPDLLSAGCSVTVGFGLSYTETWPHLVCKHHDSFETVNVVGAPGASIAKIVYMVFSHIERFGWPKELHVCLPDVHRGWGLVSRHSGAFEESAIMYDPETANFFTHDPGRWSLRLESPDGTNRKPLLGMVVRENMMALDMLSLAAWSVGVPLVISTYSSSTHKLMLRDGNRYPGYKSLGDKSVDARQVPIGHPTECCQKTAEEYCCQEETWTYALDQNHPGMHTHVHLAEAHLGRQI